MDRTTAPVLRDPPLESASVRRRHWLSAGEGWSASHEGLRLGGALLFASVVVAVKGLARFEAAVELGFMPEILAVLIATWLAGFRGGAGATLICGLCEATVLRDPAIGPLLTSPTADLRLGLFVTTGFLIALVASGLQRRYVLERVERASGEVRLEEQREAWTAAERDRRQLARLQAVTASLAGAGTPTDVADAILDRGLTALGAVAGTVFRLEGAGGMLEVLATRGYPATITHAGQRFVVPPRSHLSSVLAEARPLFLDDPEAWAARFPDSPPADVHGSPDGGAIAVLPLSSAGRLLGVTSFRFAGQHDFGDGTGDLAVRLADQGAIALDRALAHEREQESFRTLVRSQAWLAFIARASQLIGTGGDFTTGVAAVPRAAVPTIADWCVISFIDHDVRVHAAGGLSAPIERAVEHLSLQGGSDLGVALGADPATIAPAILALDDAWARARGDERTVALIREMGTTSVLVAPIASAAGIRLGSIVFAGSRHDGYGPDDLGMARDVADRISVAVEQARLFAAVARFKTTVDASADAVFMFDPRSLSVTYVNRGGIDLVGADAGKPEQTILGILASADETTFRDRLAGIRTAPGQAVKYTEVLARTDGGVVAVDVLLQEVILPDGSRTGILTARDISDRIEVQTRLARIAGDERRKAAELHAVIQSMGDGVLVVDPDDRISLANEAAATILDGRVPGRLAELEERLGAGPLVNTTPAGPAAPDAGPVSVRVADGRWLEVTSYPADLAGGVTAEEGHASRIVVIRDVTREREAAAAQEAFLGVLSHELRTPVTTIFGYARVMQRPSHEDERDAMLRDIEVESDRLYRIVEDLLALTRVEGGITIEGEPLLLQYLAGPVVDSEARRWPGVAFTVSIPRTMPAVFGERTYVEQVLRNLVSNAGKYSAEGTAVTVEAEATDTEVLVRVLDRGMGIDEDEADQLFRLYYRSAVTARKAAGAGIGLYISRGLVTAMGGRIWAMPRAGGGSEFGFSLPRALEDPSDPDDAPAA